MSDEMRWRPHPEIREWESSVDELLAGTQQEILGGTPDSFLRDLGLGHPHDHDACVRFAEEIRVALTGQCGATMTLNEAIPGCLHPVGPGQWLCTQRRGHVGPHGGEEGLFWINREEDPEGYERLVEP